MTLFDGLPMPADAPAPGKCVRIERPEPGLAVVVLDAPHRSATVLDLPLLRDLDFAISKLEDQRDVRAIVFTGRDPLHFAVGADVDAMAEVTDPALVSRLIAAGQSIYARIAALSKRQGLPVRTVAAVGGPVPGGAFELSLACDRILLARDPSSRIGLPEVKLGILPAWGGCTRLPKRVGVPAALDLILNGKLLDAKRALRKGLVDRVVPPERLMEVAADVALGRKSSKRAKRGAWKWLVDKNPLALYVIGNKARDGVMKATGGRYPAALAALDVVVRSQNRKPQDSFDAEREAAAELAVGPVCKHLIGVFHGMEGAKKLAKLPDGAKAGAPERGVVVGAGVMGGAIASLMAEKGARVRLSDLSPEALDAALVTHQLELDKKRKRRRLERHEHDGALDRLDPSPGLIGVARCDVAIEAVAERLDVKHAVFGELAAALPDDALLLTNTSSLSVDAIFADVPRPERCAGMHFFNPVRKMPLVEIVRGARTTDETVARVAALALRMGKTPVVVKDVAGFLVNRLLGPYLDEALRMYAGGASIERVDAAAKAFGMPMGPFELLDEVGLDIAAHAAISLHEAYGVRMTPSTAIQGLLDAGRLGKKTGAGFYRHTGKGRKASKELADDLEKLAPRETTELAGLSEGDVVDRLVLAMLNEAARAMDEQVVATEDDLDLATVFGMGFPPFRGGLMTWARETGPAELRRRCEALLAKHDIQHRTGGVERFTPAGFLARAE